MRADLEQLSHDSYGNVAAAIASMVPNMADCFDPEFIERHSSPESSMAALHRLSPLTPGAPIRGYCIKVDNDVAGIATIKSHDWVGDYRGESIDYWANPEMVDWDGHMQIGSQLLVQTRTPVVIAVLAERRKRLSPGIPAYMDPMESSEHHRLYGRILQSYLRSMYNTGYGTEEDSQAYVTRPSYQSNPYPRGLRGRWAYYLNS